jgi:dihydropteroate synthase
MKQAADAGARLVNDVSALTFDDESLMAAAHSGLPVVLMHAQGDPKTMQDDPAYDDVVLEVYDYLQARIAACVAAGIDKNRIIADPGIGFGKTFDHNLELMESLSLFHGLGVPLLAGASRKRFIGALTGEEEASERIAGSLAAALAAAAQGVHLLRVHDVRKTAQALAVWRAAVKGSSSADV